jgi:hypothetical protein
MDVVREFFFRNAPANHWIGNSIFRHLYFSTLFRWIVQSLIVCINLHNKRQYWFFQSFFHFISSKKTLQLNWSPLFFLSCRHTHLLMFCFRFTCFEIKWRFHSNQHISIEMISMLIIMRISYVIHIVLV